MTVKLRAKELSRRCLRGITQNSNESLNSAVWSTLTKSKHHGFRGIHGSAALVAIYFHSDSSQRSKFSSESILTNPISTTFLPSMMFWNLTIEKS
ncbi:unnamed protein product [Adineta steineri]|uniref:Uncharacterized protein n=1 Tax=Adineta steineri TaxID=433720 RepID=A0A815P8P7_9BILA|nr:unnamed protein product [Adineta steineri]CAF1453389.1 unnamed protein product [Adineta steineri]CAF3752971.1 unnamed protein product [Adineta steineri]CAF4050759.1 unnamed protein product [Adineta steineri]